MARISDSDELTKLVDSSYKNILDKFNPSARQLISTGKTYLKALQAASNAAKCYVDSLVRLARNAQQSTWAGASDVGTALMQMVDVYREVHSQQQNLLKAFYVDLLLPLETNLEKDTKVVQSEQKKFLQQHKLRQESYAKAAAAVKKLRKKTRSGRLSATLDKELKLQTLEDERARLDSFCDLSLHSAITQERRRYGFVLERQCSLAKHCLVYHTKGQKFFMQRLEEWEQVARSRERLPAKVQEMFSSRTQTCIAAALRKTKSMDVSCVDLRSLPVAAPLARAKSDFDLSASHPSLGPERNLNEGSFQHFSLESGPDWWCGLGDAPTRPRSVAVADEPLCRYRAKALYSYLSSGDHQLSFHEGDLIALIGQRNKGWQYGENLRSHRCGWFPVAYTQQVPVEELDEIDNRSPTHHHQRVYSLDLAGNHHHVSPIIITERRPISMLVEGHLSRASSISKVGSDQSGSSSGKEERRTPPPPPPPLPGPNSRPIAVRRVGRSFTSPVPLLVAARPSMAEGGVSVHSSNDSGIENESRPKPQTMPDADYSDEEKPS